MESHKKLLLANKAWAQEKTHINPAFFDTLASGQQPEFLWLGCSDSRVPAEEVIGVQPGELFVHRNIANLFVHSDSNFLSVLQYAVEYLKVKHIIVCGHSGCGGVKAALSSECYGYLNKWLYYIKETYSKNESSLKGLSDDELLEKMVELNVREQVRSLSRTSMIQKLWQTEKRPLIHGWVFGLKDGLLREQITMGPDSEVEQIYRFNFGLK